ncbi:MAG: GlgB N-terminal domain-containing protein, partial [Billgrantia desiderata]
MTELMERKTQPNDRQANAALPRSDAEALANGRHPDPFAVLGMHAQGDGYALRVYLPGAQGVEVLRRDSERIEGQLSELGTPGLFVIALDEAFAYRLRIHWSDGVQETEDPYSFGLLLGDIDLHLIGEGTHRDLGRCLGAQLMEID